MEIIHFMMNANVIAAKCFVHANWGVLRKKKNNEIGGNMNLSLAAKPCSDFRIFNINELSCSYSASLSLSLCAFSIIILINIVRFCFHSFWV